MGWGGDVVGMWLVWIEGMAWVEMDMNRRGWLGWVGMSGMGAGRDSFGREDGFVIFKTFWEPLDGSWELLGSEWALVGHHGSKSAYWALFLLLQR